MAMEDGNSDGDQDLENEGQAGGGINLEVVRSYLGFAKRAIKARKVLIALVVTFGITLTVLVGKYLPRTYTCSTVMMTVANAVLDPDRGNQPLAGAENLLLSHETLKQLILDTDLKKKYVARRPPLLALKDKVMASLVGPMDDKVLTAVLVGTLETKVIPLVEKDTLTITVDWNDGKTAAELAEACKDGFLKMRHRAEISAFHEKMAILDSHAGELRREIEDLAGQMQASLQAKAAERAATAKKDGVPLVEPKRVVVSTGPRAPATDEQLPGLRDRVATLKQKLLATENERNSRMREEQTKLDELRLRLTPSHPQAITQAERVAIASQVPSELALMRSEVADLESQIRQREAMVKTGKPSSVERVIGGSAEPTSGALPTEILGLLDEKDADPALTAQMSSAVVRYGSLRDDVRGAKLALDTAQAAFNHRYQVVIPVDEPSKPTKPKVPVILAIGSILSLLIAFVIPILLELRRDVVVEHWQVAQFHLPVLGELRLPERTNRE